MTVRMDKFAVGDVVVWNKGDSVTWGLDEPAGGPFKVTKVFDRDRGKPDPLTMQDLWDSMGHTQHIHIEGYSNMFSGALFKKVSEADLIPKVFREVSGQWFYTSGLEKEYTHGPFKSPQEAFRNMCCFHDLTYTYADDSRAYMAGRYSLELIYRAAKELPDYEGKKIWNEVVDSKISEDCREQFYWR